MKHYMYVFLRALYLSSSSHVISTAGSIGWGKMEAVQCDYRRGRASNGFIMRDTAIHMLFPFNRPKATTREKKVRRDNQMQK